MDKNSMEKPTLLLALICSMLILILQVMYQFGDFNHPIFMRLWVLVINTGLFDFFYKPHLLALAFAVIYALGTKGMKSETVTVTRTLFLVLIGTTIYFGSYFTLILSDDIAMYVYTATLFLGFMILVTGLLHIRRIISTNLMKDQFNKENKLFKQVKIKQENPYSVNLKTADGWMD